MQSPFFVIGSERSGSTMFRLMLDHHPDIACNLESDFLISQISDQGVQPDMAEYVRFLRHDRVFRHSHFSIDESLDYQSLVDSFLEQKRQRDHKAIVGATVHHDFHRLPMLWPDAKFIYLLRDGRDVANSAVRMGWAGNAYCGTEIWIEAEERWTQMRAQLDPSALIEVRFEELVEDPMKTLSRVCDFLGVAYSSQMLDYPQSSTYSAPNAGLLSQWRSSMDAKTLSLVEARIGERLASRGYQLGSTVRQPVPRWEDKLLRLHSKAVCARFRVERYGLPLTMREFVGRKLRIQRWRESAQMRLDSIIDRGLK